MFGMVHSPLTDSHKLSQRLLSRPDELATAVVVIIGTDRCADARARRISRVPPEEHFVMARQHLSSNSKDATRRPEKITGIRGTNRVTQGSARKSRPRHSIRDIFTVVSGIGLLRVWRSFWPKLALGPSATGKRQAAPATKKTAPAS